MFFAFCQNCRHIILATLVCILRFIDLTVDCLIVCKGFWRRATRHHFPTVRLQDRARSNFVGLMAEAGLRLRRLYGPLRLFSHALGKNFISL